MLLATKCPHCKTTFKVANDQLKLQSGLVRCGVCNQVFNGIEHLAPANAATSPSASIKINPATPVTPDVSVTPATVTAAIAAPGPAPGPASTPEPAVATESPRELDLFASLNIGLESEPETAQRQEPVFDAGTSSAESFFPAPLKSEFVRARSDEELGQRVQALLDQDLTGELDADALAGNYPAVKSDPILEVEDHEEIVIAKIEDLDNTFSTAPIEPTLEADLLEEQVDEQADDEIESTPPARPTSLGALLGQTDDVGSGNTQDEDDALEQLLFIRQARNRQRLKWVLSFGTLILLVVLLGQVAYQFRDLIAATYPPAKDSLVQLCRVAGCQVKLPAQLNAISKDVDELHTLPRPGTFEFTALLKNHGDLTQAWPSLELVLKDSKKQVVLRKVFTPGEYLGDPHEELAGFAANSEQSIKVYFVVGQVQATDYVASIFYP